MLLAPITIYMRFNVSAESFFPVFTGSPDEMRCQVRHVLFARNANMIWEERNSCPSPSTNITHVNYVYRYV